MNRTCMDQQWQQMSRFIKHTTVLLVLTAVLSPLLTVVAAPESCTIIISNQDYVVPGCDEHPDPSSPGLGI